MPSTTNPVRHDDLKTRYFKEGSANDQPIPHEYLSGGRGGGGSNFWNCCAYMMH